MNHIDPFAPANSPQHPANFHYTHAVLFDRASDAMPYWIELPDVPVSQDNPDAAVIGDERWASYDALLAEHGSAAELQYKVDHPAPEDWTPDSPMPTLAQLRLRAADAHQIQQKIQADADEAARIEAERVAEAERIEAAKTPEDRVAEELAKSLAKLDKLGL